MVLEGGVEPPRPRGHTDLNRARLPIPPLEQAKNSLHGNVPPLQVSAAYYAAFLTLSAQGALTG